MSIINVSNLSFTYEGSFDPIFEGATFSVDTDWKLGFIGRNGKGKTTFLNLLLGKMDYQGSISTNAVFDYFPYQIKKELYELPAADFIEQMKDCEQWKVICELDKLKTDVEVLYRPFYTLSFGEQTKVMLAVLFSGDNDFLLIDEPTNHLDADSREIVKNYLYNKKGFLLVSHDRDLLDACIDHVLVLNRNTIEVQKGNLSSWWENKKRQDSFAQDENEKHINEINKLKAAADRTERWAQKSEGAKIGFDPLREHDRSIDTRCHIASKTKKMQSRVKQMEQRISREISEKEGLLQDIETPVDLKIMPLPTVKKRLITCNHLGMQYETAEKLLFSSLSFEINEGEAVFLNGKNGCGKSTLIKAILQLTKSNISLNKEDRQIVLAAPERESSKLICEGELLLASNLIISYVSQDTSFLQGSICTFCEEKGLDFSLFCSILRQLDFGREQFAKNMEDYSEGQKKKVLLAASLMTPAHLYVWDEPLNYVDVFSRMQLENLISKYKPTMLLVEHDVRFREKIGGKVINL